MKNLSKLAVLGAALAVSSSFAFADSVSLSSVGALGIGGYTNGGNAVVNYVGSQEFSNDTTGCSGGNSFCLPAFTGVTSTAGAGEAVNLNPLSVWNAPFSGSTWVGINANAGPQNTSNPNYGYYVFTTSFSADGGAGYDATFNLLADDSLEVFLNGDLTPIITFGMIGSDVHCADTAPTCLVNSTFNLSGLTLGTNNVLTFVVEQEGTGPAGGVNDPSGFDFTATLNQTPEPSSLLLLGTGLVGAAGAMFRRRLSA